MKKIEISEWLHNEMLGVCEAYEDWQNLVAAIEANNEKVEGMTKVYLGYGDIDGETIFTNKGEQDTHYAYITKPQPIKKEICLTN